KQSDKTETNKNGVFKNFHATTAEINQAINIPIAINPSQIERIILVNTRTIKNRWLLYFSKKDGFFTWVASSFKRASSSFLKTSSLLILYDNSVLHAST